MLRERNDLEDLLVVEHQRSRPLGTNDGKLYPSPSPMWARVQDPVDPTKYQFLGRTAFPRRAPLQSLVQYIWYVEREAHVNTFTISIAKLL
jgi:hypothetical protein